MFSLIVVLIVTLAVMNLARLTAYLVGADIYTARAAWKGRGGKHTPGRVDYRPSVTLIVPVHNEGIVVERTLASLLAVDYSPLQIVVADDGSTDDTGERIIRWKREHDPQGRIEVFTKPNSGKADTLNVAMRQRATGELVMCLDGDSTLAPDAVTKSVAYFADPRVEATASNVVIIPDGTVLGFIQRFEYLVSHHQKKAQTAFNCEYIIGGIGSMFRRATLEEVGFYDTNTMTEDIDLTLKIIAAKGNTTSRVVFAADSLVYTEGVPTLRQLYKQRTRWKYGRAQAFYKNWRLFFSRERRHSFGLSWFMLPLVLVQEALGLLEPLMLTWLVFICVISHSLVTVGSVLLLMGAFNALNVAGNTHLSGRTKWLMIAASPLMYVGFYVITVVEYVSLLYLIVRMHKLPQSVSQDKVTWVSPDRVGVSA